MTRKFPKLSRPQSTMFGGLVAVACNREPYPWLRDKLLENEYIHADSNKLTERGVRELERLMALLGLKMGYLNAEPEIQAASDQRIPEVTGITA